MDACFTQMWGMLVYKTVERNLQTHIQRFMEAADLDHEDHVNLEALKSLNNDMISP